MECWDPRGSLWFEMMWSLSVQDVWAFINVVDFNILRASYDSDSGMEANFTIHIEAVFFVLGYVRLLGNCPEEFEVFFFFLSSESTIYVIKNCIALNKGIWASLVAQW